jgi:hypothetical protein
MSKYRNQSVHPIIIAGPNGVLMTIAAGQIVELDFASARKGMPYLKDVSDFTISGSQPAVVVAPSKPKPVEVPKPVVAPIPSPVVDLSKLLVESPLPLEVATVESFAKAVETMEDVNAMVVEANDVLKDVVNTELDTDAEIAVADAAADVAVESVAVAKKIRNKKK